MWLNAVVRKNLFLKECCHGKGVFCAEDIDSGEEILQFGGQIVGFENLPQPYTSQNDYYLQIGECKFLGPSGNLDDYVNHSCVPNAGVIFGSGVIKLIAVVFIPVGSQITFDYSTTMDNFGWEMACACGSNKCRQKVQNFVDISEHIQAEYVNRGIVPNYIIKKLPQKKFGSARYEIDSYKIKV